MITQLKVDISKHSRLRLITPALRAKIILAARDCNFENVPNDIERDFATYFHRSFGD
jgi:hypothetical protein